MRLWGMIGEREADGAWLLVSSSYRKEEFRPAVSMFHNRKAEEDRTSFHNATTANSWLFRFLLTIPTSSRSQFISKRSCFMVTGYGGRLRSTCADRMYARYRSVHISHRLVHADYTSRLQWRISSYKVDPVKRADKHRRATGLDAKVVVSLQAPLFCF